MCDNKGLHFKDESYYTPSNYLSWETQKRNNHIEKYIGYFYSVWTAT